MATVYSLQAAATIQTPSRSAGGGGSISSMLSPIDQGGVKRILYASYTTPVGGLTAGDVLLVGRLPVGARVYSATVCVPAGFATTASSLGYGVLDLGTLAFTMTNSVRWGSAIDLS